MISDKLYQKYKSLVENQRNFRINLLIVYKIMFWIGIVSWIIWLSWCSLLNEWNLAFRSDSSLIEVFKFLKYFCVRFLKNVFVSVFEDKTIKKQRDD